MPESDFDFLLGTWEVEHDKLIDPFASPSGPRVRFASTATVMPILDGLGTVDETRGTFPDGTGFVGFSLRLYDPSTDEWAIWWASKANPGVLDEPVRGRFINGRGTFVGPAETDGRSFLARFHWLGTDDAHPVWEQDFSFDGGETWEPVNWRMRHTRVAR
ncbi:MAG TPA: hypothetical protein VIP82_10500 [Microbacterium sp.]|uniref:hypothetical protein n=1 Tax=Microbacterium sp. TaxID=51671 RepID=UPI002F92488B